MKYEKEILEYLKGEKFSNNFVVTLEHSKLDIKTREDILVNLIKDKDVIHIGCSDHIQLICEKIASNKWLHKLITENAKSCIGIDTDQESIEFLTQKLNYKNVFYGDVISDSFETITDSQWDYVVFGEMIEHLDNPVDFLISFREKYHKNIKKFIITVPNIYCKRNLKNMLKYEEIINSDHRYWFTPYTISKLIVKAGYRPEELSYANLIRLDPSGLIIRKLKRLLGIPVKYPFYYFYSLIITGTLN